MYRALPLVYFGNQELKLHKVYNCSLSVTPRNITLVCNDALSISPYRASGSYVMWYVVVRVKVEVFYCSLEQTTMSQRGSRIIALLFLYPRPWMWLGGQSHAPSALPSGNRPGTHCIGAGWAHGPFWCGTKNLAPHRDSTPTPPSSQQQVIIPIGYVAVEITL
jgi:hypothetical protein